MQEDYERQQKENEEIRRQKEEEAKAEAAARANMSPEQVAECVTISSFLPLELFSP